jgi:hypothetical protein
MNGRSKDQSKARGRTKAAKANDKPTLTIEGRTGETDAQAIARAVLTPSVLAGCLLFDHHKGLTDNAALPSFLAEVQKQATEISGGNFGRLEEMLASQAHALDAMFYSLVNRSRSNSSAGYLDAAETYMKLALRAQAQCRATAESIATIKNPPVIFAKQANIAAGHQQINNGSRAEEIQNRQTKLLEAVDGERLDTGTQGKASRTHPQLAAVGTINGAEVS